MNQIKNTIPIVLCFFSLIFSISAFSVDDGVRQGCSCREAVIDFIQTTPPPTSIQDDIDIERLRRNLRINRRVWERRCAPFQDFVAECFRRTCDVLFGDWDECPLFETEDESGHEGGDQNPG